MEVYAQTTTLVILDLPENASITLDHLAFTSTKNFKGIKYIEPGIHLLTYGFDKSDLGMRNGFFFNGRAGVVLAWQWDSATEQLQRIHEQVQGRELHERKPSMKFTDVGLQSLHPYLTAVPSEESDETNTTWSDLTSHITVDLLNRVLPRDWSLTSQTVSTNDDIAEQLSNLPSSKSETILNFTPINLKRTFDSHAFGRERTEQMLDKSWYLNSLLQQLPDELALLGELQLSFLTVLYTNNFSGFETWKKLFTLFCGCKSALTSRQQLFRNFLIILRRQFDMCSEETFSEVVLEGNFVNDNLRVVTFCFNANLRLSMPYWRTSSHDLRLSNSRSHS
jgi:A1 cistron-splicing factor AAR2